MSESGVLGRRSKGLSGWVAAAVAGSVVLGGGASCVAPGSRSAGQLSQTSGSPGRVSRPVVEFPSPESLSRLESQPAVPPTIDTGAMPADGWRMNADDVAVDPGEAFQPRNAWEVAFATDAAQERPQVRLTRALACVAREMGRFMLDARAQPPEPLLHFMIAACGAVVPTVGSFWLSGDVPASVTDDQVLAQWRGQIKKDVLPHLAGDATDAGFWFGRGHQRAIAIMIHAVARVQWKTLSMTPDAQGNAILEGELRAAAEYIQGWSNQGRYGVAPCAFDPSIARPRFRATCAMAKDDTTAWVQLMAAPPRHVLASSVAQILLRRAPGQPLVFETPAYSDARPVHAAGDFSDAILIALNAVRAQAGLRPVQRSIAESARASRLAGHFFADAQQDVEQGDRIALGLLAGWQVEGLIRDGHFTASLSPHTHDAGQWLNQALSAPIGRATLMNPDVDTVSLGTVVLDRPDALGAVVTGYRLYQGDDHSADVKRLYGRLLTARRRLGLGMPSRLGGMDRVINLELARVKAGLDGSAQALQATLNQGVSKFGAGMRGYVIETTSLDAFEIPEAVVRRPNLFFEFGVAHYRAPGAAWGQLVILVIFADPDNHGGGTEI